MDEMIKRSLNNVAAAVSASIRGLGDGVKNVERSSTMQKEKEK